jgi:transcriptional regulator with XRE-family HTH domain
MASEISKLLGKRIRHLRSVKGLTQSELAEECELSDNFIALLERGRNSPSIFTLEKLARAFRVSMEELFAFDKTIERSFTLQRDKREKAIRKLLKGKNDNDVRLIAKVVELIRKN